MFLDNQFMLCFFFCFGEFRKTHTHFASCVHFAQTLCLVLYGPHLEQLLEESRLCPVVHRLHVCRDWVILRFEELLQEPGSEESTRIAIHFYLTPTEFEYKHRICVKVCCTYQSSCHRSLSFSFVGFLPFPDKDLGPSLIQDVAVLTDNCINHTWLNHFIPLVNQLIHLHLLESWEFKVCVRVVERPQQVLDIDIHL